MTSFLIDVPGAEQPALWEVAELLTVLAPTEQHAPRSAWPAYRALHLIAAGHLVLRVNIFTNRADLTDPQCGLGDTRKRADKVGDNFFGLAEERAAREFAAAKRHVVFGPVKKHRFGRVWLRGRALKLTPAGEQLLARWSRLQNLGRTQDDRLDTTLAALAPVVARRSSLDDADAQVIELRSRRSRP